MSKREYTACDGHTPHRAIDRIAALEPSCDRDALLALADEMELGREGVAAPNGLVSYKESAICDFARRIREAVGA